MVEMYYILLHLGQSAQIREIQMYYFLLLFKAGVNCNEISVS